MGTNADRLFDLLANGLLIILGLFFIFVAPKQIRAAIASGKSWATEKTVRWFICGGIALVVIFTLLVMDKLFFHLGER